MLQRILPCVLLMLCCSILSFGQKQFSDLLFYDVNVHSLNESQQKTLDSLILRYYSYNDYEIEIIGHADSKGSIDYNKKIAAQRATVVKNYLSSKGIPNYKIKLSSKGDNDPLNKRKSSKRGTDRRVEIVSHADVFNSVDDLLDRLGPELQSVIIDNSIDQNITLKDGTEIFIPAKSLVYANGNGEVSNLVTIEVKESFDVMDFIAEDLHTKTANEMLQTGGMIFINAKSEGNQLGIKPGNTIDIKYPEKTVVEGMGLYDAVQTKEGISWQLAEGEITSANAIDVTAELDISILLDQDISTLEMPTIEFDKMPKIPVIPVRPIKPQKPLKPSLSGPNKELNLAKYQKSLQQYEKNLETYKSLDHNYDDVKLRAETELKMWELEVEQRFGQIEQYERAMKNYYCDYKLNDALTYVQQNYGVLPSNELFVTFKSMVYTDIKLEGIEDPYEKAFGSFKKHILKRKKVKKDYLNYNSYNRRSAFNKKVKPLIDEIDGQNLEEKIANGKQITDGELDRYMFSVGSFGYHNVDKPKEIAPEEMLELAITDEGTDTKYYVVLKDAQSVIAPQLTGDTYTLEGLPKNHDIMIVGVKLVDSIPQMAVVDVNTGSDNLLALNLDFQKVNLNEIRSELESMNAYAGI